MSMFGGLSNLPGFNSTASQSVGPQDNRSINNVGGSNGSLVDILGSIASGSTANGGYSPTSRYSGISRKTAADYIPLAILGVLILFAWKG